MRGTGSTGLVLAIGVVACSPNTGAQGSSYTGQVGQTAGEAETSPESATSTTGGADDMATGGGSNVTDASATGPTTMPPGDESADGPMSTTDSGEPSTTDGGGPMQEDLAHIGFGGCNVPLWCYDGSVDNPAGGPMWMQECFTATLPPPFSLTEIDAVIRGIAPALGTVQVEVYASNGASGPGALIDTRSVDSGSLVLGLNSIPVDPPIVINQPNVCIGLAAPDPGLAGSLGVSIAPGSQLPDLSFFRLETGGGCWYPSWTEIIGSPATQTGNWCMRATIETQ